MSLRAVALVSGVAGGLCWLALLVLDRVESGSTGLHDALHWAGLVLLGCAMVGFGASLVSRSALWLRVIVGIAFPALVWSVLEVFHPAGDPEVDRRHLRRRRRAAVGHRPRPAAASATGRRPRGVPTAARTRADTRRLAAPPGMRQTAPGFNHEDPFPEVDVGPVARSCGDDQPAHLPARPAGDGRRRRHERLRHRARPAAGRARHRGRHLHPRHDLGAPAGRRGRRRRPGPPHHRRPVRGADQGRAARAAVRLRPRGAPGRGRPAGRPLRHRALPLLAQRPGRRARARPVGRAAGALDAHDGQGQERRARRRRHPRADGPDHRRGAGRRGRRHADRQHRHRGQAADQPVRRRPRPGRGRPPRRRPVGVPPDRPGRGPGRASTSRPTRTCCSSPAGSSRSRRPTCCCGRSRCCSRRPRSCGRAWSSRSSAGRPAPASSTPSRWPSSPPSSGSTTWSGSCRRSRRHELARWCAAATLVAVPSYNESFGLVAVEAQATGTPVVAAAVGGLTTVVRDGHSGLLVDSHEPRDWAAALRRVIEDDGLRDRLARRRARAGPAVRLGAHRRAHARGLPPGPRLPMLEAVS